MTNDMLNNMLKYLTGNITEGTPSNNLIYSIPEETTNNLDTQLTTALGSYTITGIVQGKDNDGNGVENNVIYGNYDNNNKGFMVVIDEYGNVLQIITKFTSGVNIGRIYALNVDENGFFYMVEYGIESSKVRFVMLNNICIKSGDNYEVNIRRAYAIPNTSLLYNATSISKLAKSVGQAKYIIAGTTTATYNNITYTVPLATQLTINVGAENEWVDYKGNIPIIASTRDSVSTNIDIYATWSGDTLTLILLTNPATTPRHVLKYTISGTALASTNILIATSGYVNEWGGNSIIVNSSLAYFAISGRLSGYISYEPLLFEIDLTNNSSSLLYQGESGQYDVDELDNSYIQLLRTENDIFFLERMYGYDFADYRYTLGKIREDSQYYLNQVDTLEIMTTDTKPSVSLMYINRQFNLYNMNFLIDDNVYNVYQVYNSNNYNGTPIEGVKSLLPISCQLYNSSLRPLFAKNLYNKVITNNTTVSTVDVPKDFVNNVSIYRNDLISYNQNYLVVNYDPIITNQYEALMINYINTINITDRNKPSYPVNRDYAAKVFNNSICNTLDYTDKQATKIRYTYHDETTEDFTLNWNIISLEDNLCRATLTVSVSKLIDYMTIMSADGTITYAVLDTSSMEVGKDYSITQDVHID